MITLSKFNPHDLSPEIVKAVATGRGGLLRKITETIKENLTQSAPVQHILITGPRGMGKSFLLRHLQVEINQMEEGSRGEILFMLFPEEQPHLKYPENLIQDICSKIEGKKSSFSLKWRQGDHDWEESLDRFRQLYKNEQTRRGKFLVVVALENFDLLLDRVFNEKKSQSKLRNILERFPGIMFLITSQKQDIDQEYSRPLFKIFLKETLKPWTEEQYFEYYHRRRNLSISNQEIKHDARTGQIQTNKLRAISKFTGGSPRMAVILTNLLLKDDAVSTVKIIDGIVDDLTPYYQDLIGLIPDKSLMLFDTLLRNGENLSQSEIAEKIEAKQGEIARAFKWLIEHDYVRERGIKGKRAKGYSVPDRIFALYYQKRYIFHDQGYSTIQILADFLMSFYGQQEMGELAISQLESGNLRSGLDLTQVWLNKFDTGLFPESYINSEHLERRSSRLLEERQFTEKKDPDKQSAICQDIMALIPRLIHSLTVNGIENRMTFLELFWEDNSFPWWGKLNLILNGLWMEEREQTTYWKVLNDLLQIEKSIKDWGARFSEDDSNESIGKQEIPLLTEFSQVGILDVLSKENGINNQLLDLLDEYKTYNREGFFALAYILSKKKVDEDSLDELALYLHSELDLRSQLIKVGGQGEGVFYSARRSFSVTTDSELYRSGWPRNYFFNAEQNILLGPTTFYKIIRLFKEFIALVDEFGKEPAGLKRLVTKLISTLSALHFPGDRSKIIGDKLEEILFLLRVNGEEAISKAFVEGIISWEEKQQELSLFISTQNVIYDYLKVVPDQYLTYLKQKIQHLKEAATQEGKAILNWISWVYLIKLFQYEKFSEAFRVGTGLKEETFSDTDPFTKDDLELIMLSIKIRMSKGALVDTDLKLEIAELSKKVGEGAFDKANPDILVLPGQHLILVDLKSEAIVWLNTLIKNTLSSIGAEELLLQNESDVSETIFSLPLSEEVNYSVIEIAALVKSIVEVGRKPDRSGIDKLLELYLLLGTFHGEHGIIEDARLYLKRGITLSIEHENEEYYAKASIQLSDLYYQQRVLTKAQTALRHFPWKKEVDTVWGFRLILKRAVIQASLHDYEEALLHLQLVDHIATAPNFKKEPSNEDFAKLVNETKAWSYFWQARIHTHLKELNKAKEAFDQLAQLVHAWDVPHVKIAFWYAKGSFDRSNNDFESAISNHRKAFFFAKKHYLNGIYPSLFQFAMGIDSVLLGKFDSARSFFNQCGEEAIQFNSPVLYNLSLGHLAALCLVEHKKEEARALVNQNHDPKLGNIEKIAGRLAHAVYYKSKLEGRAGAFYVGIQGIEIIADLKDSNPERGLEHFFIVLIARDISVQIFQDICEEAKSLFGFGGKLVIESALITKQYLMNQIDAADIESLPPDTGVLVKSILEESGKFVGGLGSTLYQGINKD